MKRARRKAPQRVIRTWRQAKNLLEGWRRECANLRVELRRPRAIDAVPIDFLGGEPVAPAGEGTRRFHGRLIYFTGADLTIRRPSGAILVIDHYEIAALSDGKRRIEPTLRT